MRTWLARWWPHLVGVATVSAVGAPAAVASYRHARTVVERSGDPAMADWLPLTTDGMLLAALVVMWARRLAGEPVGRGPWAAFGLGMAATVSANLAAAQPTPEGYLVALWPPAALAVTLELVALLVAARPTSPTTSATSDLVAAGEDLEAAAPDNHHTLAPTPPVDTAPVLVVDAPTGDALAAGGGDGGEWMTDLVVRGVARDVAAARRAGKPYGRARVAREHQLSDHQARQVLAEIERRDLAKAGA